MSVRLPGGTRTYQTNFPTTENPLSDGGVWVNGGTTGLDWTDVAVDANGAKATQNGNQDYRDSIAMLTGTWGNDQMASARVRVAQQDATATYPEVELHLRRGLSAHSATGYEVFFSVKASDPYAEIVCWNGAYNDWTSLIRHTGAGYEVVDGDYITAAVVGTVLKGYVNGVEKISWDTASDAVKWASGNPGLGMQYAGTNNPDRDHYGLTSFFAADGIENTTGLSGLGASLVVTMPFLVLLDDRIFVAAVEWQQTPGVGAVVRSSGTASLGAFTRDYVRAGSAGVLGFALYSAPVLGGGSLELTYTMTANPGLGTIAVGEFDLNLASGFLGQTDANSGTGTAHTSHSVQNAVGSLLLYLGAEGSIATQVRRYSDQPIWVINDGSQVTMILQYKISSTAPTVMTDTWGESVNWWTVVQEYLTAQESVAIMMARQCLTLP